jgi:hypothetical protein
MLPVSIVAILPEFGKLIAMLQAPQPHLSDLRQPDFPITPYPLPPSRHLEGALQ